MPTFDAGATGLTPGVTILDAAGAEHVARSTAGITEPVAGSGVYLVAEHDAAATLTYVWDVGVGGVAASETLYAGRGVIPAAVGAAMTLTSPYDAAKTAAAPGANMVATNMVAAAPDATAVQGAAAAALTAYDPPTRAEATTDKEAVIAVLPAAAPLATANASAVRTNLTTELARIDENVSAAKTLTSGERTSIASAVSGLATTGLAALKALVDAVLAKTNTIGALSVTVTSPVAASGTITIEQGDSYPAGRSRAIDVNVDDVAHVKGLDDETVTVYLLATQFTWEAASVTETAGGYLVRFEPTIVETAALALLSDRQSYKLKAFINNVTPTIDDAETIQRGAVVMNRDIPAVP